MSLDGKIVVAHDDTLGRMCGEQYANQKVHDFNFDELPPMKRAIDLHFDSGAYNLKDEEDGKFTLLETLFENLPKNVMYSIDLKERNDECVRGVNNLVIKYGLEDKVIWGSMFKEQHEAVMQINPNVSVFYSGSTIMKTYLCWLLGCIFCCPLKGDALMTTHMTARQKVKLKEMLARRGRTGCCMNFLVNVARCVHCLSPGLLRHVKARGNVTIVWTA